MGKSLIIYFSHTGENYFDDGLKQLEKGNTEIFAEHIAKAVDGELFKVEAVKEYPNGYYACCDVAKEELHQNLRPELKKQLADISAYDTIFVGYPIWWGTMPMAMFTQLEKLNFQGKKVAPFATHEGSGFGHSLTDVQKCCSGAKILDGLQIRGCKVEKSENKIAEWAKGCVKK